MHRPILSKEFDLIRDCKISHQLWKEVKVGRTKKNPRREYYKKCANLLAHWKLPYMLAEEHLLPHVFCRVFTCGNLCEKKPKTNKQTNKQNRSIELNTQHSDIPTIVGPEENQWGYNGCIQLIYHLFLIKFDTTMYGISTRVSFKPFLPTCFRYQIHSGIEHGHDLGTTKNRWIRNQEILRLSAFIYIYIYIFIIGLMIGFKAKARASAYLTKLGWIRGWVFVCVCVCVCVCERGGYGWGLLQGWECIVMRGRETTPFGPIS